MKYFLEPEEPLMIPLDTHYAYTVEASDPFAVVGWTATSTGTPSYRGHNGMFNIPANVGGFLWVYCNSNSAKSFVSLKSSRVYMLSGLLPFSPEVRGGVGYLDPNLDHSITIDDFSRDYTIFDSARAFGGTDAVVTLSGTGGNPGDAVQIRAEAGAESTDWVGVGTVQPDGTWTGSFLVPRSTVWYTPQARVIGSPEIVSGGTRFGVGDVIALTDQSMKQGAFNHAVVNPDVTLTANDVQVITTADDTTNEANPYVLDASTTNVTGILTMAAELQAASPGGKFVVIDMMESGVGYTVPVNDASTARSWAAVTTAVDLAQADGSSIGWFLDWHGFSNNGSSTHIGRAIVRFGKNWNNGSNLVAGTNTVSGLTITADHFYTDVMPANRTKYVFMGDERLQTIGSHATTGPYSYVDKNGATVTDFSGLNRERARTSFRMMPDNAYFGGFSLSVPYSPMSFATGPNDTAAGTYDQHADRTRVEGVGWMGAHIGIGILFALGIKQNVPVINRASLSSDKSTLIVHGNYSFSTPREEQGLMALSDRPGVWGFVINDELAMDAEIVGGAVHIRKNDGSLWLTSDVVGYGVCGCSYYHTLETDIDNDLWKNLLITPQGSAVMPGMSVTPLPDASIFTSVLTANGATTGQNSAPVMTNTSSVSNTQGDTVNLSLKSRFTDPDGDIITLTVTNLPTGLSYDDTSGEVTGTATAVGSFSVGITASDGTDSNQYTLSWAVSAAQTNSNPQQTSDPSQTNKVGDTVSVDLSDYYSDPDGDTISFAVSGLPSGLSESAGVVTGTASTVGDYTVNVSVSDDTDGQYTGTFLWSVKEVTSGGTVSNREDYHLKTIAADTMNGGAGLVRLTVNIVGTLDTVSGNIGLLGDNGVLFCPQVLNGDLRYKLKLGGVDLIPTTEVPGVFSAGQEFNFRCSLDTLSGRLKIWVDGVLLADHSFTSVARFDNRFLYLVCGNRRYYPDGDFSRVAVWLDSYVDTDTDPASEPDILLEGDPAVWNNADTLFPAVGQVSGTVS